MTITTKYDVNNEFWFMLDNKPVKRTVDKIIFEAYKYITEFEPRIDEVRYQVKYGFKHFGYYTWIDEDALFPTKEELLKSL